MKTLKVLMISFVVLFAYFIYWLYFEENRLLEKVSPSGENSVIINEYGNWPLGAQTVKIYFKEDGKTKKAKKINLHHLKESNHAQRYNIVWRDENTVSIAIVFESAVQSVDYNFSSNSLKME